MTTPTTIVSLSDVFISYSRRNTEFARRLFDALRADGFNVWADWADIPKGAEWRREIEAGIAGANTFLFIISPDSVNSVECRKEIEVAVAHRKRILPLLHIMPDNETLALLHPAINAHNWVFAQMADPWPDAYAAIVQTLNTDLPHLRQHTRLTVRAKEWDDNARDSSYVLAGRDVSEAESWLTSAVHKTPPPTELHSAYIQASRAAAVRRQRSILAGVLVALAVSVVLLIVAVLLGIQATNNADLAATNERRAVENASTAVASAATAVAAEQQAYANQQRALGLALAAQSSNIQSSDEISALALAVNAAAIQPDPPLVRRSLSNAAYQARALSALDLEHDNAPEYFFNLPDERILTATLDGVIVIWDIRSTEPVAVLDDLVEDIRAIDVTHDGRWLATGSGDGLMSLIDLNAGGVVRTWQTREGVGFDALALSPDATLLLSSSVEGRFSVWDIESAEEMYWETTDQFAYTMRFSPDGAWALIGLGDGRVVFWQPETPDRFYDGDTQHERWVSSFAFSRDGRWAASGEHNGDIVIWDIATRTAVYVLRGHTNAVQHMAFSADKRRLLSASWDRTLRLWEITTQTALATFTGHEDWVMLSRFIGDESQALSVAYTLNTYEQMTVWDLSLLPGHVLGAYAGSSEVVAARFAPDGQTAYVAYREDAPALLDLTTGAVIRTYAGGAHRDITSMALSPDGALLATGDRNGLVTVWEAATGAVVTQFDAYAENLNHLSFSPDLRYLAVITDYTYLQILEMDSEEEALFYETSTPGWLDTVIFHPDGSTLYFPFAIGQLMEYNWRTQEEVRVLGEGTNIFHTDSIYALALNADSTRLLSGGSDTRIILWDLTGETPPRAFIGHTQRITALSFGPDETTLLSASYDGEVWQWDTATGERLRAYSAHGGRVNTMRLSPDGRTLLTGADCRWGEADPCDRSLLWWRVDTQADLMAWVEENRYVRELSCDERALYGVMPLCALDEDE